MNHDKLNKILKFRREILNAKEAGKFFRLSRARKRNFLGYRSPEKEIFRRPEPGERQIFSTSAEGVLKISTSMRRTENFLNQIRFSCMRSTEYQKFSSGWILVK